MSVYRAKATKASCRVSGCACHERVPSYPSDVSDAEWALLRPQAQAVMAELRRSPAGRPMEHDLRRYWTRSDMSPAMASSGGRIVCALLGLWLALIVVGFVVKALLWLAIVSLTAFVVTVAAGVGLAVHPARRAGQQHTAAGFDVPGVGPPNGSCGGTNSLPCSACTYARETGVLNPVLAPGNPSGGPVGQHGVQHSDRVAADPLGDWQSTGHHQRVATPPDRAA
jgi:hypothetical protein